MKISKPEKKILAFIEAHIPLVILLAATLLGLYARFSVRRFQSADFIYCYEPWYLQQKAWGGLMGLGKQLGDYSMLWQTLLACVTYLPVKPIYAVKFLVSLFDVLQALVIGLLAFALCGEGDRQQKNFYFAVAYSIAWCSPLVVFNSAAWAQCDSMYSTCILAALGMLCCKEKPLPAMFFLGLAFSFKLQSIFILPFFLLVYFALRKFSILTFAAVPATMVAVVLPNLLQGRKVGEIFALYREQAGAYSLFTINYPAIWGLFEDSFAEGTLKNESGYDFQSVAIVTALLVLGILFCTLCKNTRWQTSQGMFYLAFMSVYTCVLFMPGMHERYGYVYEMLAIIVLLFWPQTLKYYPFLIGISLVTYGSYLRGAGLAADMPRLTVLNMVIYCCYAKTFVEQVLRAPGPWPPANPDASA